MLSYPWKAPQYKHENSFSHPVLFCAALPRRWHQQTSMGHHMKRHITSAAIGGILGFGFGFLLEVFFWLSISDDIFSWSMPKFLGLLGAFCGALEPLREQKRQ